MTTLPDDEIITEVRANRNAHAAKFNYDIDAIASDLKLIESQYIAKGVPCVQPPPRELMPNSALQRTRFARR
jgi:hypothetical protein